MKARDLVLYAARARDEGWGYVLGAQGEVYTHELARKWTAMKQGGKSLPYFMQTCSRWFGRRVVDCSGLIIEALRSEQPGYQDQTADTLYTRCVRRGSLATLPDTPGLCVWRRGHIGIYVGNGRAIEARGAAYGVVETEVHARGWTNWGMLRDIDYGDVQDTGGISSMAVSRLLMLKAPMLRGDDVRWLQTRLNAAGHACGIADGIFGGRTDAAVRSFQKAAGLAMDGIAGKNTVAALGGAYTG